MKKHFILLSFIIILPAIFLIGCGKSANSPTASPSEKNLSQEKVSSTENGNKLNSEDLTRSNNNGQVTVSITFANPMGQEKKGYLTFITMLNTHSIDLASMPLNKYAKLYDAKGALLSDQAEWETEGEGHHLVGKLHFKTDADLRKIDGLKLVLENFGGADKRDFYWEKKYLGF